MYSGVPHTWVRQNGEKEDGLQLQRGHERWRGQGQAGHKGGENYGAGLGGGAVYLVLCAAKSPHVLRVRIQTEGGGPAPRATCPPAYLLVHELPGVLLDVALVEVGGHAHEPNLGQAEVGQLDVAQ